jgi:predicted flap endonuclease-1-like 5' DNA nuclease
MDVDARLRRFSDDDRQALLALKGVGPTVLLRFEEIGISSFSDLAGRSPEDICDAVAATLGASCWKNSPASKRAVAAAVTLAKESIA